MVDEPSDPDFEAVLRQAPQERWEALWAAVGALDVNAEHTRWGGGEQVGTTVIDGVEKPVTQMPYAIYSDALEAVRRALGAAGLVVPFAWPDWEGIERYRGGRNADAMTAADAVRMVTAILRSERFGEGSIGGALADGTLPAVVRRLRRWYDEER